MTATLVELYKHNLWANFRLFDACAALSDETLDATGHGTYGSVRNTLAHIARSEAGYVAGITGGERPAPSPEPVGLNDLRERVRRSGEALVAIAAEAAEDTILHVPYQGQVHAIHRSIFLIQAINHATDHRSQICTILTQQNVTPPDLQGWAYDEERQRRTDGEGGEEPSND